ncbi:MAG: TfoX/Sxy family protein [Clostridiales bacterium]|nr:TfoX/Sxy family protein [Clostridiales bacterium]
MATTKDYRDFILEQLSLLDNITCRAMMGEFLLYCDGVLFGGIYDNRLLVKKTESNKKYNMQEQIPYESAKPMYFVDDIDNKELLKEIVLETCKDLPKKK